MTTIEQVEKKCAICGEKSFYFVLGSTNSFGSPDLDTRPAEMARSTMEMWIQTCPACGYCNPDISETTRKNAEIVRSDSYQRQLKIRKKTGLARAFLCYSLIQENNGDYLGAAWSNVNAAWACDDARSKPGAIECRTKAVTLFKKAKENGQKLGEQVGAGEAILVDLLRRSGKFKLALKTCDDGLKQKPKKLISDVLRFQKNRITRSDVDRYTIQDAAKWNDLEAKK